MGTHAPGYSSSGSGGRRDVTAIGDMRTAPLLIRTQKVSPHNLPVIVGHKNLVAIRKPIGERFFSVHIARKSVGLSGANDRFKNGPDDIRILGPGFTNRQHAVTSWFSISSVGA